MNVPYTSSIVDDDLGAHTIFVDMTTIEQVGILRGWHLDCMDRSINRSYSVWNSIPIAPKLFPLFIRWPSYALLKIRPQNVSHKIQFPADWLFANIEKYTYLDNVRIFIDPIIKKE